MLAFQPSLSPDRRPHTPGRAAGFIAAALGLASVAVGCTDPFGVPGDSATSGQTTFGETTTTGAGPTSSTTEAAPTTAAGTTTSGTSDTTGTPTTGAPVGPQPIQRCQLVDAPDLLAAACEGANDCPIRAAQRLECSESSYYPHLVEAPGGDAALYVQTRAVPTFADQHEAFTLTAIGAQFADIWVTDGGSGLSADLMPRADGLIELWHQSGQSSVRHYLPNAAIDLEGYSVINAVRDDIASFIATHVRPDDVPMAHFTRPDPEGMHALFDLPGGRVEQPLIEADAYQLWLHETAGTLRMSWADYDSELKGTYLYVRDLEAAPELPGVPLVRISESLSQRVQDAVLSPFGNGTHGVVMTDRDIGQAVRLVANEPWTHDETLGGTLVDCEAPTCNEGCEAAPSCKETRAEAHALALQNGESSVRAWHLECLHDVGVTWTTDNYFDVLCLCDKCRCQANSDAYEEKSCDLVASELAPDPNAPDKLLRTELWRQPLGFHREDLSTSAVAGEDTLWLLTNFREPTPGVVLWTVDID